MNNKEASVEAVRDQLRSLAARRHGPRGAAARVRMQRVVKPTPCWRITARIGRPLGRPYTLRFTSHEVELGGDRIVLPATDLLTIVSAGWKDDTLTLCVAEAGRPVREPDQATDEAQDVLRLAAKTLGQLSEPARLIAATRALRAMSYAIANSSIQALTDAASAPSDVQVLIRALQQPDAIETLKSEDPLGPARLRGLQERERLLRVEGGTLSADEVASHLNVTRQAVNKRRQQGALVALDAGRHGFRYPAWQLVRAGTLAGLEPVLDVLEQHDPWMQHIFMVSPNTRLNDRTPLEDLREGHVDAVLQAARAFGEHGAA